MTPFIYPFQLNLIRKELNKLLGVVYLAGDYRVYQATKDALTATIHEVFGQDATDHANLFAGITEIKGQRELNAFIERLLPYVIPFTFDSENIRRLFKKEKKLTVPSETELNLQALSYLGWRDAGKNQLYLVYPYLGEITGITARYTAGNSNQANTCCLCNTGLKGSQIGLVVAKTKAKEYQSVGNYMCLESNSCNERITSMDALEDFFGKVMRAK